MFKFRVREGLAREHVQKNVLQIKYMCDCVYAYLIAVNSIVVCTVYTPMSECTHMSDCSFTQCRTSLISIQAAYFVRMFTPVSKRRREHNLCL